MKYIITESQDIKRFIVRRLPELESFIVNLYPYQYPCDYNSLQQYMMALKIEMFEVEILDWFDIVPDEILWDVVSDVFRDDIVENYMNNCKDR